jgi:hypothetical protein
VHAGKAEHDLYTEGRKGVNEVLGSGWLEHRERLVDR